MRNKLIIFILFLTFSTVGKSQSRLAIGGFEAYSGFGITYFSGDLGGTDDLINFDPKTLNFAVGGGLRYYMTNHWAVRGNLFFGRLAADDALSTNQFRKGRNLNFQSNITDVSLQIEYSLFNWNIKGVSRKLYRRRNKRHNIYLFTGISMFKFNPKGELNGEWYDLQKLSTEGQGLDGGAKPYKLYSFSIPIGGGYKYLINKNISIGFEITFRKTFTDYIDDVSGNYYDNDMLRQNRGDLAASLADRNLFAEGTKRPSGEARGNPNSNDNYAFFLITINKKLNFHRRPGWGIPCPNRGLE